jgi:hypothetical protein
LGQTAAGADGALLTRPGTLNVFKANLGVVATVADRQAFSDGYSAAVKTACRDHGLTWKRPFCRAADLRYFSGSDQATVEIIEQTLKQIEPQLTQVHVVYTMLFPGRVPKVFVYANEPTVMPMNPVDFQDALQDPYPYLCLWRYLQGSPRMKRLLVCDHFTGEVTLAWKELERECAPQIFFDGANTNALVSIADLLVRLLGERFGQSKEKLPALLHPDRMPGFLPELENRIQSVYLGQKFLRQIVPLSREKIDVVPQAAHPIVFVVKEPTSVQTRDFISRSTVMDSVYQAGVRLGGCVKFFDSTGSVDQKLIQPGDGFLWMGEHGRRFVESLPNLGYANLKAGDIKDIDKIFCK